MLFWAKQAGYGVYRCETVATGHIRVNASPTESDSYSAPTNFCPNGMGVQRNRSHNFQESRNFHFLNVKLPIFQQW